MLEIVNCYNTKIDVEWEGLTVCSSVSRRRAARGGSLVAWTPLLLFALCGPEDGGITWAGGVQSTSRSCWTLLFGSTLCRIEGNTSPPVRTDRNDGDPRSCPEYASVWERDCARSLTWRTWILALRCVYASVSRNTEKDGMFSEYSEWNN